MNTKINLKGLLIKSIVFGIIGILLGSIQQIFSPIITNEVAINQLNSTTDSFALWQGYQKLMSWSWVLMVIIFIIMFWKDIKIFIKIIKTKTE